MHNSYARFRAFLKRAFVLGLGGKETKLSLFWDFANQRFPLFWGDKPPKTK